MRRPGLVIFDCDGVLVDSETISNQVLSEVITEAGWPISYQETRARFIGMTIAGVQEQVEARLGRRLSATWVADMEARRNTGFAQGMDAIPGVEAVIQRLRAAGVAYCVASSGKPEKMATTLGLTGLAPYFEGRIFSVTMVARPKPHPDLFLHAAATMGAAPGEAVVIEDTVIGVRAAVAAGISVFGYGADSDPAALAEAGAVVFDDMAALPGLIGL